MLFVIVSRRHSVLGPDGLEIVYPAGWTGPVSETVAAALVESGAAVVDADRSAPRLSTSPVRRKVRERSSKDV